MSRHAFETTFHPTYGHNDGVLEIYANPRTIERFNDEFDSIKEVGAEMIHALEQIKKHAPDALTKAIANEALTKYKKWSDGYE